MPRNKANAVGLAAFLVLGLAASPSAFAETKAVGRTAAIELPAGDAVVPDRPGALFIDRDCLSCHSAELIMNQPALTRDIWRVEIDKMRTVFGAKIAPDDVEAILSYLTATNGVRRDKWR